MRMLSMAQKIQVLIIGKMQHKFNCYSADNVSKCVHYANEESVTAKSVSSSRKKRRKSKKSSKKNGCKTPAFSFEYNRATVSSKNKKAKVGPKKKKKKKKKRKKWAQKKKKKKKKK